MRIKEGYIMKKLGSGFVVVTVGPASAEFNGAIRMNGTGAFLWQSILDGASTREQLVSAMLEQYDGLDEATAAQDLDAFLGSISFALEA